MYVLIKDHKFPHSAEIIRCKKGQGTRIAELYQRRIEKMTGKRPAITWKIAEGDSFISAMIESTKMP